MIQNIKQYYDEKIYWKYFDLKNSGKLPKNYDNYDLSKIFEYYSCIKITEEFNKNMYAWDDVSPDFKELNNLSQADSGIDGCDLTDTIMQNKLRKSSLTWGEVATFFGSQNTFDDNLDKTIVKFQKMVITRNKGSKLSKNLLGKSKMFTDREYDMEEMAKYCENLFKNPPKQIQLKNTNPELRDYQKECINLINDNKQNIIISLPTGTGKSVIMINSMKDNLKYLILVPRIILMEQLRDEIIKCKPGWKTKIQTIGNNNNKYDKNKNITICVFNSVKLIENYCDSFEKIYIDEAHHINKPEIYKDDNIEDITNIEIEGDDENENDEDKDEDIEQNDIEDIKDDTEDELVNVKNYTEIIKGLAKYNNNIYLSATIDARKGFLHYSKDIRYMIDKGYLSDYIIKVPIFSDDPSNKNICQYLLNNYRNIIIYSNTRKEAIEFNNLMNNLQKNSCAYIDYKTPTAKRKELIKKYKEGILPFLINVRILVEGFDAPITTGVCFLHMPASAIALIQIIGRALRLHQNKTLATIILPYSIEGDGTSIIKFLKIIAQNDTRLRKSYNSKKLGGYISIYNNDIDGPIDGQINEKDSEFKYDMIYDSMITIKDTIEIWLRKLEMVTQYICKYNKTPSVTSKNVNIKVLGSWLSVQKRNYKNKLFNMNNKIIYQKWEEYIILNNIYFDDKVKWLNMFEKLTNYIDLNGELPRPINIKICEKNSNEINDNIKMFTWLIRQKNNYKLKLHNMKIEFFYNKWTEFINIYDKYLYSPDEKWNNNLNQIKIYIDTNNKLPSTTHKDCNIASLGTWIYTQKVIYKNNSENELKRNAWLNFINDEAYSKYFVTDKERWLVKFQQMKIYINTHKEVPSKHNIDEDIGKLGAWIIVQKRNYRLNKKILKNEPDIYNLWHNYINDDRYNHLF